MMSKFKFCPMCGSQRQNDSNICQSCGFEFLVGKYVKVEDEKESKIEKINVEKVSQEEFVESNDNIRQIKDNINTLLAKYLNYSLTNQFNGDYSENISFDINEYILSGLNRPFEDNLQNESSINNEHDENYLQAIDDLLKSEIFVSSKNIFLNWIDENRSHLPGLVLNQYTLPIQQNINILERIDELDLEDSEENRKFIALLNDYLNSEKEFLDRLL